MSQRMGQGVSKDVAASPTSWVFSVNLTTTAKFSKTSYRVITGGATINLNLTGAVYTGTIKFNVPNMQNQQAATQNQKDWSTKVFGLVPVTYAGGILSFTVPAAATFFATNFNADNGAPITPPVTGPGIGPVYNFTFTGTWDGSSTTITGGQAFVPPGWLEDAGGVPHDGEPPSSTSSTGDGGGDGGGEDPPNATWGSG